MNFIENRRKLKEEFEEHQAKSHKNTRIDLDTSQLCRLTAAAARASKICRARAGVSASDVNPAPHPKWSAAVIRLH